MTPDDAGYADKTIADSGALHLVPTADARSKLQADYGRMVDDG